MTAYDPDLHAYGAAVARLLGLANRCHGTQGGTAAAQVLLSSYNGGSFHLDPTAILGISDFGDRNAALTVLVQRVATGREPQVVIKNGDQHFASLWEDYGRLEITKRYRSRKRR